MVPPSPGAAPHKNPTPVPRRIAGQARRHSCRGEPDAALDAHDLHLAAQGLLHHPADLGEREQADHRDQEAHPLLQLWNLEGETRPPALQIDAHGRDREPEKDRHEPLGERVAGERAHRGRANSIRAKYSVGPNFSARLASGAATKVSAVTPSVPAMKELTAAIASAAPARPWRASG